MRTARGDAAAALVVRGLVKDYGRRRALDGLDLEAARGAVTAVLSYYGKATRLFTVSAGNFMPRPKVDSAVMQICLYGTKPVVPQDEALMLNVIRAAFGQRRKTLLNALSSGLSGYGKQELTDAVQRCGLSPNVRGETMSVAQFAALADALCAARA